MSAAAYEILENSQCENVTNFKVKIQAMGNRILLRFYYKLTLFFTHWLATKHKKVDKIKSGNCPLNIKLSGTKSRWTVTFGHSHGDETRTAGMGYGLGGKEEVARSPSKLSSKRSSKNARYILKGGYSIDRSLHSLPET